MPVHAPSEVIGISHPLELLTNAQGLVSVALPRREPARSLAIRPERLHFAFRCRSRSRERLGIPGPSPEGHDGPGHAVQWRMMTERGKSRLAAPFVGLGLLVAILIGLGVLASQPVITLLAAYSSLAFVAYARFVGRVASGFDVIYWALPGAVAASVATIPVNQPWLVSGSEPTITAAGVGLLYGATTGACIAFVRSMVRRLSTGVAMWTVGLFVGFVGLAAVAIPACGCSTHAKAYVAAMKSDLRNLATAQEAHYTDHGVYAAAVGDLHGYSTTTGVHVQVLAKAGGGWLAVAAHDHSDTVCRIFVGGGVPQRGTEGQPHCIEDD